MRDNTELSCSCTIVSGKDLLVSDLSGTSDPYAKIAVGSRVHQTRVIKKELNPKWNERFLFTMKVKQLLTKPLVSSMWYVQMIQNT